MALRDELQATLGHAYSIERELGGGGMARVFLAEESRLNRKVVVKMLAPELAAELSVDRFEREIQMAAQLQHPQIVPVFSAGEVAGVPFYTMPFIDGESLRARLSRGQLPYREVIDILRDVAKALAFAHSRGVVHRDIKPDNVLLTSGSAVVTDFGIAKAVAASQRGGAQSTTLTQAGVAIGTPAYIAPEQAAADPNTDHRADLYAFGCVAYEMIAGEPPFTGRTAAALLAAHLAQPAMPVTTLRADVPPALVSMVSCCLEKDPGARPANAAALLEHLDAAAAELSGFRSATTVAQTGSDHRSVPLVPQPTRDADTTAGPVVAVLPFRNLGGAADTDYFVDGLTDDLITALTRFRDVTVIGRNTSFHHRHRVDEANAVGRDIGARYVIDGSLRRLGDTVRLSARLTDVTNGRLLWSETYDRHLTAADLFALQDEIIAQIVGAIAGSYGVIARSGLGRLTRATENLEAYDCVLRAYAYEQLLTPESHADTRDHLERAVRLDPTYADAWSKLAFVYADEHAFGYNPRPNALDRALASARKGVELDPASQMTHWHLARALFWRNEVDAAMVETERALSINPNNAFVLAAAGVYMAFTSPDRLERGAALTEQALRIDPHGPGWYHVARMLLRYARREYEASLAEALRMDMPGFYQTHMWRLAIHGQLRRSADATASREKLVELFPTFANVARRELAKLNVYPELASHLVEGWRMAGFDPAPS